MTVTVDAAPEIHGYEAIRNGVALVEIDLGYLEVSGPGARDLIDSQVSRGIGFLLEGQMLAALLLDGDRILTECAVYRLADGYLVEVPAVDMAALVERLEAEDDDTTITVRSDLVAVGVEGPYAWRVVADLIDFPISAMAYQSFTDATWDDTPALLARSGVTGEYGYRLLVDVNRHDEVRQHLRAEGCAPVDAADLDTCRCEMRFPALGANSRLADYSPLELGVQWMIDFDHEFVGRDELLDAAWTRRTICWIAAGEVDELVIGAELTIDGQRVGVVTESRFSPRLGVQIGSAVVDEDVAATNVVYTCDRSTIRSVSAPFMVTTSFEVPIQ